jgi:hydrogenase maturation protease
VTKERAEAAATARSFCVFPDTRHQTWQERLSRITYSMAPQRILVLGVGNILLKDEGVGVRVIEQLQATYSFSSNVRLMDGGTLGIRLLDDITAADHLIVVDAVRNKQPPGTLYRLLAEELKLCVSFKNSLHQTGLLETLAYAEMLEQRPTTVVVGIEPEDITPWGTELTPTVMARVKDLLGKVIEEIQLAGGQAEMYSE